MSVMGKERQSKARSDGELLSLLGFVAGVMRRTLTRRLATETWVQEGCHRPPAFGVLSCIARMEPVSQKQISARLGADPSDLVAVVDALEAGGFVSRDRDSRDRRRYALTLTPRGRKELARFKAVAAEVQDEILAPLDAGERAALQGLLHQVVDHHVTQAVDEP
jgi:DNA-binding MarR family transcriptional regulator